MKNISNNFNLNSNKTLCPGFAIETEPLHPMAGGNVKFIPVYDSKEKIQSITWNFGDGSTSQSFQPFHKYKESKNYSVSATIKLKSRLSCNYSSLLPLDLEPGDLLFVRNSLSNVIPGEWSHIGIYVGNETVVEALPLGVTYTSLSNWYYPDMTWVQVKRVSTSQTVIDKAVSFAENIADTHASYDYKWLNPLETGKQTNGNSWYCSELVWAAYLTASNGTIDLDSGTYKPKGNLGIFMNGRDPVTPSEIYDSPWLISIGEHKEYRPNPNNFIFLS